MPRRGITLPVYVMGVVALLVMGLVAMVFIARNLAVSDKIQVTVMKPYSEAYHTCQTLGNQSQCNFTVIIVNNNPISISVDVVVSAGFVTTAAGCLLTSPYRVENTTNLAGLVVYPNEALVLYCSVISPSPITWIRVIPRD